MDGQHFYTGPKYGFNRLTNNDLSPNQYSQNNSTSRTPINMNNPVLSSNLNPNASPYTTSYSPSYFNLTSIAKNKQEAHNNISKPLLRLNSQTSDTRSNHSSSSEQLSSTVKKHKRDTRLDELRDDLKREEESIDHYNRKRKRLINDLEIIKKELKSCDNSLYHHRSKLKSIQIDIEKEQRRLNDSKMRQSNSTSTNALDNLSNNKSPLNVGNVLSGNSNPQNNQISKNASNNLSPSINLGLNSINISLKSNKIDQTQKNAQSTICNILTNLLDKKRDVEFQNFEYIFSLIEENHEATPIDMAEKIEIKLNFKKLVSSEEKKSGIRYIIRGCIYDSKSLFQTDNLSYVKSYDFITPTKKHVYENSDSSLKKLMFPFDITDYCRFDKSLKIVINLDKKSIENKKIAFGVYHVKKLDYNQTLDLIQKKDIIKKKKIEVTKSQVANSFNQIGGVEQETLKIVLLDPLSKAKISMPCIGESCEHISTFDGLKFLESNSRKFSWFCPICGRPIGYDQLFYDELINEILRKVSMDCTSIEFDKKSNWIPLSESNTKKNVEKEEEDCITLE